MVEAETAVTGDEEKAHPRTSDQESNVHDEEKNALKAMQDGPKMTNTFSWEHLTYHVTVSGEKRCLLDDVFGYVAPGKLTALMGESGAGKVGSGISDLSAAC